jgi:hypothetical protein
MAYIGTKPADKPLTSADITDGIVSIADLSATGTPSSSNFLRGDGTWNAPQAGFSGATENAIGTSAITLTSASTQYQKVQINSTTNNYVTLPVATTMTTKGTPVFVIENVSPLNSAIDIKNSAGTVVYAVPHQYVAFVTLVDNSTSAGLWSVVSSVKSALALIPATQTTTLTNVNEYNSNGYCFLTSTKLVTFGIYNNQSTFVPTLYMKVGDISAGVISYGSEYTWSLGANYNTTSHFPSVQMVRLSDTAFVIRWGNSGNDGGGTWVASNTVRACTVSGTVITQGGTTTLSLPQTTSSGNANEHTANNGIICRMSDTKFAIVYNKTINSTYSYPYGYSGSLTCQICTISGATITAGTAVDLGTSTYTNPSSLISHDTDKLCLIFQQVSAGSTSGKNKVNIISVSTTTPTWGTSVDIDASDISSCGYYMTSGVYVSTPNTANGVALSTTKVIGSIAGGAAVQTHAMISISGTTPTVTGKYNLGVVTSVAPVNSTTLIMQQTSGTYGFCYVTVGTDTMTKSPTIYGTANGLNYTSAPYYIFFVVQRSNSATGSTDVGFFSWNAGTTSNTISLATLYPPA